MRIDTDERATAAQLWESSRRGDQTEYQRSTNTKMNTTTNAYTYTCTYMSMDATA